MPADGPDPQLAGPSAPDWEPSKGFDPEATLMAALVAKSEGRPYNETEVEFASHLLAVGALVAKGLDVDTAIGCVQSALQHGDIQVTWSEEEGIGMTIGKGVEAGSG